MIVLLKEINQAAQDAGGCLNTTEAQRYRKQYRDLLCEVDLECHPPVEAGEKRQNAPIQSKKPSGTATRL